MNLTKNSDESIGVHLFVCSWAPPIAGGPRNLFNHLKFWPTERLAYITSYLNLTWCTLELETWLNITYEFFEYRGSFSRKQSRLVVDSAFVRFRFLEKFDVINEKLKRFVSRHFTSNSSIHLILDIIYQLNRILRVFLACCSYSRRNKISSVTVVSDMGWGLIGGGLFAIFFSKRLNIFLFDLYADNYLIGGSRYLARFFEPILFRFAKNVVVTNEVTAEFYLKKYQYLKSIEIVRNSSDLPVQKLNHPIVKKQDCFTIAFAGRIYWPHFEAIENLLGVMKKLEGKKNILLKVFVIDPTEELKEKLLHRVNIEMNYMDRMDLFEAMKEFHLLFVPFGWNTPSQAIIETASPAKFTDYLATGVPLLVHAPAQSFVARVTLEKNLGYVVSKNSQEDLLNTILEAKKMYEQDSFQMGQNCIKYFRDEYLDRLNSDRLWRAVNG